MIMDVNFTYVFCNTFDDSWKDSEVFVFLDSTKKIEAMDMTIMLSSMTDFNFVHCYQHKKTIKSKAIDFENIVTKNLGFDVVSTFDDLLKLKAKKYSTFCYPPEIIEEWI